MFLKEQGMGRIRFYKAFIILFLQVESIVTMVSLICESFNVISAIKYRTFNGLREREKLFYDLI